jgi:hypothetical protein
MASSAAVARGWRCMLEPRNSVVGLSPRVFDGLGTVGELHPSMTILDLDQLTTVTGGRGGFAPRQQQQQQQQGAQPQGDPAQGGDFLSGLDQFLSFFQSDSFQQILGGLRGMLGQFGGAQQQPQQAQPQGDSAAQ